MDALFLDHRVCVPRKNSRVGVVLMLWGAGSGDWYLLFWNQKGIHAHG